MIIFVCKKGHRKRKMLTNGLSCKKGALKVKKRGNTKNQGILKKMKRSALKKNVKK